MSLLETICSVKNTENHNIFTIFGIKIKIKRQINALKNEIINTLRNDSKKDIDALKQDVIGTFQNDINRLRNDSEKDINVLKQDVIGSLQNDVDALKKDIISTLRTDSKRNIDALKNAIISTLRNNSKNDIKALRYDIKKIRNEAINTSKWHNFLDDERLYSSPPQEERKDLFKKYVKWMDIEVFSFCNRRCWFCPNSHIDRHSQNIFMPDEVHTKIINELAEITYSGIIYYNRYNEPFSDRITLDRLCETRQKLPHATLRAYTNGDYITREYLDEIAEAGLNTLHIMRYPLNKEDEEYDEQRQKEILTSYAEKLNLPFEHRNDIALNISHPSMTIEVLGKDPKQSFSNRADSITVSGQTPQRRVPCLFPFTNLYIDYNGSVLPCCNMRSDVPQHAEMIMGNVVEQTVFDIYTNLRYSLLRYQMRDTGDKIYPCNVCDDYNNTFAKPVPESCS